jgi:hypothetical protein
MDCYVQELAREAGQILDRMREEKREVMKKITTLILYACKEVKFQCVETVTYTHR